MVSSEIEMAIKIGKARLRPERTDPQFLATLSKLGINLDKELWASDVTLSPDLRALTTHGGDNSIIRFAKRCCADNNDADWEYFMWGICYLFPVASMNSLLFYTNLQWQTTYSHVDYFLQGLE